MNSVQANTHSLMGHREQVTCAAWSSVNAFQLVTADVEGCCFVWDLRRSSPLLELGTAEAPKVRGSLRSMSDRICFRGVLPGGLVYPGHLILLFLFPCSLPDSLGPMKARSYSFSYCSCALLPSHTSFFSLIRFLQLGS